MKYDEDRPEMLSFVPSTTTRLLDVGCDTGRFARALSQHLPNCELWGIDPTPPGAGVHSYHERITGSFPDDVPPGVEFDCIVFNDVLEHMADPWAALRATHALLAPGATVVASIPNIRNVQVLRPLLLRGRWDYADSGILDRTHLRFFTRSTASELFGATGYRVVRNLPVRFVEEKGKVALVNSVLRGRLNDFFTERYGIAAVASPEGDRS